MDLLFAYLIFSVPFGLLPFLPLCKVLPLCNSALIDTKCNLKTFFALSSSLSLFPFRQAAPKINVLGSVPSAFLIWFFFFSSLQSVVTHPSGPSPGLAWFVIINNNSQYPHCCHFSLKSFAILNNNNNKGETLNGDTFLKCRPFCFHSVGTFQHSLNPFHGGKIVQNSLSLNWLASAFNCIFILFC